MSGEGDSRRMDRMSAPSYRTDRNNNPAAFTTGVAVQAGLVLNRDYVFGEPFEVEGLKYNTAKLLGDPVSTTIQVIDKIGYFTSRGHPRWEYIALPRTLWQLLSLEQKRDIVGYHYKREGGTEMRHLFPNYDKW